MHARAQAFRLARKCIAYKESGEPRVPFNEAEDQKYDVTTTIIGFGLFAQDHVDPRKDGVFCEGNQTFEHFCLTREVPIQSGF